LKFALISDIHANLEALEAVVDDARKCGVDRFICLGDIVGYGADPGVCLEAIKDLDCIAIIQGNHDVYAADERDLSSFNPLASRATIWTREQLTDDQRAWLAKLPLEARLGEDVSLVHATPGEPESWAYVRFHDEGFYAIQAQATRFCFYGHTHIPMAFQLTDGEVRQRDDGAYDLSTGTRWLINVGSVGQPRDGDWRAAWSLLDLDAPRVDLRRVEYDLVTCQQKIVSAGLPPRLAERLAQGR
jgi:diadenosine tetraphosphatase ApaH/serine/threonine PP2A family protein phosphatase